MPSEVLPVSFDPNSYSGSFSRVFRRWAEDEDTRLCVYDHPNLSSLARTRQAAKAFQEGRSWPYSVMPGRGPLFLWEMLSFFLGITGYCEWPEDFASDADESERGPSGPPDWLQDLPYWSVDEDARLSAFLNNSETRVKIFLSSYARRAGFLWTDANCDNMGPLLEFFLKFLLRHQVLPEMTTSLYRAIAVAEAAKVQLPSLYKVSRKLPDSLNEAFATCWGREIRNVHFVSTQMVASEGGDVAWGSGSWCQDARWTQDTSWGSEVLMSNVSSWAAVAQENAKTEVETTAPLSLMTFLGPTILPLTHVPGVREESTRRLKEVIPLSSTHVQPHRSGGVLDPAAAVEQDFQKNFFRLVLEPAPVEWVGPDFLLPSISQARREASADGTNGHILASQGQLEDDITLFIEADEGLKEMLEVGMGLRGTWCQFIRKDKPSHDCTFWYLESLTAVLPAFWTVNE